jgi:hypothetical protein
VEHENLPTRCSGEFGYYAAISYPMRFDARDRSLDRENSRCTGMERAVAYGLAGTTAVRGWPHGSSDGATPVLNKTLNQSLPPQHLSTDHVPPEVGNAAALRRARSVPRQPSGARGPALFPPCLAAAPHPSAPACIACAGAAGQSKPLVDTSPNRSRRCFCAVENRDQGHATVCWPEPEFHAARLAHVACGLV